MDVSFKETGSSKHRAHSLLRKYEYSSYSIYIGIRIEKLISSKMILSCFKYYNKGKLFHNSIESDIRIRANSERKIVLTLQHLR
jgi:glutamine amidotransferase-like uncharacterized protein